MPVKIMRYLRPFPFFSFSFTLFIDPIKIQSLIQRIPPQNRASDKKIKLEIALKEATEFHDALQAFVDWLTGAEKTLGNAKPVSRVMETLLSECRPYCFRFRDLFRSDH